MVERHSCRSRQWMEAAMPRQLALPLESDPTTDPALRRAWLRSGLRVPFHIAVHVPALAICLRHLAGAGLQRKRVARA
jgi:hypothetical protein